VEREGRQEIVLFSGKGAVAVAAESGRVVWRHEWEGAAMLQPAVTGDGGLLLTTGGPTGGAGTRRIALAAPEREEWTSRGLKPYYNDLVVHEGHAYGFDGGILACVDLQTGERRWKGGRYGHGQMLLLAEQGLLLVVSEEGEVALVRAKPEGYEEVARMKGVEGKTWNHPVVAGGLLVVRNGQEMAAWRVGR
jgi:outer membrane protein assembly factor BamB